MRKKKCVIRVAVHTLFFVFVVNCLFNVGECSATDGLHIVETKHTSLVFNSAADVAVLNDAINYPPESLSRIFSLITRSEDAEKEVVRKVDLLFEKVQQILDMRRKMKKVRVRLFSNADQLGVAYYKIYRKKNNIRGWYVHDFNTIYLNVRDVHEGVFAHELGHSVIDHFLSVRPPRATAEILAKYVDKHLFEEVKKY